MQTETLPDTLPAFFTKDHAQELPSVARWAFDKVTFRPQDDIVVEGRRVLVRAWYFQGKFTRRQSRFFKQWDSPETGRQFNAVVAVNGGTYRGQPQTITIGFTEYVAADGLPLPT